MATITFDAHTFVRKLKESGFDESELVAKKDMQIELAPIISDLKLLKWMVGVLLALAVANFAKQFF